MINVEAIQRVHVKADGSATLMLNGPRKALHRVMVPAPYGRELFDFMHQRLAIVEFGMPVDEALAAAATRKKAKSAKTVESTALH